MQLVRFVRTLGFLLVLGLAEFGGGCSPGSRVPTSLEAHKIIQESHRGTHQQLKADAKKVQADIQKQGAMRKGAHRGAAGR
jgi:hypothetical protein